MKKYYEPERVRQAVPLEPIPDEVRAEYLRPGELLHRMDVFPVAYMPIGTLEWHGRHNPIGCDAIKAHELCIATAKETGGVVMPPLYFGSDAYWDVGNGIGYGMDACAGFQLPGSFYGMDGRLLQEFIMQAARNYLSRGFEMVIIVSGHNAQMQQLLFDEICYRLKEPEGAERVIFTMEYTVLPENDPHRLSDHAAYYETSMMRYHLPERVRMDANDHCEIEELALSGDDFRAASAEDAAVFFEKQVKGLSRLAKERYAALPGRGN